MNDDPNLDTGKIAGVFKKHDEIEGKIASNYTSIDISEENINIKGNSSQTIITKEESKIKDSLPNTKTSRKERIAASTLSKGLKTLPASFDDSNGDWIVIESDNLLEVLYLDYVHINLINPEIVKRNYEIIEKFWKEKKNLWETSSQTIKKRLEDIYTEKNLANCLNKLQKTYKFLSTFQGISEYSQKLREERLKKGQIKLEPLLKMMVKDGEANPVEIEQIFEEGLNYDLSNEEIAYIVKEYFNLKRLLPQGRISSGKNLKEQLLSVVWSTENTKLKIKDIDMKDQFPSVARLTEKKKLQFEDKDLENSEYKTIENKYFENLKNNKNSNLKFEEIKKECFLDNIELKFLYKIIFDILQESYDNFNGQYFYYLGNIPEYISSNAREIHEIGNDDEVYLLIDTGSFINNGKNSVLFLENGLSMSWGNSFEGFNNIYLEWSILTDVKVKNDVFIFYGNKSNPDEKFEIYKSSVIPFENESLHIKNCNQFVKIVKKIINEYKKYNSEINAILDRIKNEYVDKIDKQQFNNALYLAEKTIELFPDYLNAYLLKTYALNCLTKYDEGLNCINSAIEKFSYLLNESDEYKEEFNKLLELKSEILANMK